MERPARRLHLTIVENFHKYNDHHTNYMTIRGESQADSSGTVLPLMMVDNSTITPIRLTVPSNSPYDQEALSFSQFKQRG